MLPRFLADAIDSAAATAHLGADETRHLTQVLRLGVGDEVAVFDGMGSEFHARVDRVARGGADLRLIGAIASAPEPSVRLTLAQAVLKGDKMDDVVRDATMMGVSSIVPLITDHTVAHVRPGAAPDRWTRIAIASAKQCRRAVVPRIDPAVRFGEWLATDQSSLQILLTEPSAAAAEKRGLTPFSAKPGQAPFPSAKRGQSPFSEKPGELPNSLEKSTEPQSPTLKRGQSPFPEKPGQSPFSAKRDLSPFSATLGVGPEGGWSAAEVQAAVDAGFQTLTLGRRTLRADAVALVAIGVLQHRWDDL